jgi:hypothetical protein
MQMFEKVAHPVSSRLGGSPAIIPFPSVNGLYHFDQFGCHVSRVTRIIFDTRVGFQSIQIKKDYEFY